MSITNDRSESLRKVDAGSATAPTAVLTGALAASLIFAAVMQGSVPRDALIATTATLILALAGAIALLAWLRPLPPRHFTYWDAAGVLTFIGICAAALMEPDQLVRVMATASTEP